MTLKCFIFYNPWNCFAPWANCRLPVPCCLSYSVNTGSIRTWETYYRHKKIYPIYITDHISESCVTLSQGLIHILTKYFIMVMFWSHAQPFPWILRRWWQKVVTEVKTPLSRVYGGQRAFACLLLGFPGDFWPVLKNVTDCREWCCCDTLGEPTLHCSLPVLTCGVHFWVHNTCSSSEP